MNNGSNDSNNIINPSEIINRLKKFPVSSKILLIAALSFDMVAALGIILLGIIKFIGIILILCGVPLSIMFFAFLVLNKLKSDKNLKNTNLDEIKNEFLNDTKSFKEYETYFTEKHFISNYHYAFIVRYSDISMLYRNNMIVQFGTLLSDNLVVCLKNHTSVLTVYNEEFINEIKKHYPEVMVGNTQENKKRYEEVCKMFNSNPINNDQNSNVTPSSNILSQTSQPTGVVQPDPVIPDIPLPPSGYISQGEQPLGNPVNGFETSNNIINQNADMQNNVPANLINNFGINQEPQDNMVTNGAPIGMGMIPTNDFGQAEPVQNSAPQEPMNNPVNSFGVVEAQDSVVNNDATSTGMGLSNPANEFGAPTPQNDVAVSAPEAQNNVAANDAPPVAMGNNPANEFGVPAPQNNVSVSTSAVENPVSTSAMDTPSNVEQAPQEQPKQFNNARDLLAPQNQKPIAAMTYNNGNAVLPQPGMTTNQLMSPQGMNSVDNSSNNQISSFF